MFPENGGFLEPSPGQKREIPLQGSLINDRRHGDKFVDVKFVSFNRIAAESFFNREPDEEFFYIHPFGYSKKGLKSHESTDVAENVSECGRIARICVVIVSHEREIDFFRSVLFLTVFFHIGVDIGGHLHGKNQKSYGKTDSKGSHRRGKDTSHHDRHDIE